MTDAGQPEALGSKQDREKQMSRSGKKEFRYTQREGSEGDERSFSTDQSYLWPLSRQPWDVEDQPPSLASFTTTIPSVLAYVPRCQ